MWSQSQATVRAQNPTSQVRKCVSTDCHCVKVPEMMNLKEGKVSFDSQLQGFPFTGTRFCCFGLVLRPNMKAGSVWWTKAALITVANSDRGKKPKSHYFKAMPPMDFLSSTRLYLLQTAPLLNSKHRPAT